MLIDAPVPRNLFHTALGLEPVDENIPASFPMRKFWHVLRTSSRQELNVRNGLKQLKFDAFLPMLSRRTVKRGKRVIENDPLFPGYVFVAFDRENDDWGFSNKQSKNYVRGAEYILGSNHMPRTVDDLEIERLMRAEQAGAFDFTRSKLNFAAGDKVEIQEGPFAGMIAKVKCASPKRRVRLLLESLASIEIDPATIVRV